MDRHSRWIAICMLSYFTLPLLIDAKEIYCFKKIHNALDKEGPICRGLINKSTKNGGTEKSFKSPRGCCKNGGVGYAQELTQLGRRGKKYRCLICTYKKSNGKKKLTTAALKTTEAMDVTPAVMTKDLFVTRAGQTGWTEWGPWTECSVSCGIGTKRRQKLCLSSDCNNEVEETTSICVLRTVCPVDGGWGPWSKYSKCPVTCGGGNVTRQRRCNNPEPKNGGKECPGDAMEATPCSTNPCPVDGGWSDWKIGSCTVSCGRGRLQRNRTCTNPSPSNGGMTCQGTGSDYLACHLPKCPVDGGWSLWSSWNDCDSTCGHGTKTRTRECVAPKPKRGGQNCTGSAFDEGVCVNLYPCQVNGGWSPWSAWGPCLARPCTGERGNTTRSRTCSNPLPQYGGTDCVGVSLEWQPCLNNEQCPVDGDWCAWGEYSPCLPHDTGEFKLKTRQCRCPAPESGGQLCPGIDFDIDKCPSTTTQSSRRCRRKTALLFDDTSENGDDLDGSGGYEDDEDC